METSISVFDANVMAGGAPTMGSLGGVPTHHNYKRAVVKSAPKRFAVEMLVPQKLGSSFCYGMRVIPVTKDSGDDSSLKSSKSHVSIEYDIWRRWEDCLWFQDILETEYKVMARAKRSRLAAGKGVKKNGMYKQSHEAASFESLPPGPDANDIAEDIHAVVPKLTKKGTIFRASQATIDQRQKEFSAMIMALFGEHVPMLIRELRENRLIRDFFGYWRRDKDHDRKANEAVSKGKQRESRASVASGAFSMYFSASNLSLQLPSTFSDLPPSPALPHTKIAPSKEKTLSKAASFASSISSSSSSSSRGQPQTPVPASAPPTGYALTVGENGVLMPASPTSEEESYGLRSAPPTTSPVRWPRVSSLKHAFSREPSVESPSFVPDNTWQEMFPERPGAGLPSLPEDQEYTSEMAGMPPLETSRGLFVRRNTTPSEELPTPVRRPRNNSCPDPHNRQAQIFTPSLSVLSPAASVSEREDIASEVGSPHLLCPSDIPKAPLTNSTCSRQTSVALSGFSIELSRRSSWRTSIASASSITSIQTSSIEDDCDWDQMLPGSPITLHSPLAESEFGNSAGWPRGVARSSVATMNSIISNSSVDAVLPRRPASPLPRGGPNGRRSLSAGSRRSASMAPSLSVSYEDSWYEHHDDLLEAYFNDASLRPPSMVPVQEVTGGRERTSHFVTEQISTPEHFPKPFQNRPPGQFHLPWTHHQTTPTSSSPTPSSPLSSKAPDSFTIKAIRQDSIVLLRASHSMTLSQVREKLRDKFSSNTDSPLTDAFTIGFQSPSALGGERPRLASGRARSSSTSAVGILSQPRLRFVTSEDEWQDVLATCAGKLPLHIFDRF